MRSTTAKTAWIVVPVPNPSARLRLICFPHAGGGPSMYASWPRALPPEIELCAVQCPGREGRLGEPPVTSWEELVDRLSEALTPWTQDRFILFGHSLGAIFAYEIACRLSLKQRGRFTQLFVSGCRAPHLPLEEPFVHGLPKPDFVQALNRLDGTPAEILQCPELLEHFMPALRADFLLWETYRYRRGDPLTEPISVYGGRQDALVTAPMLHAWRRHTSSTFRCAMFDGGHFFLKDERAAVLAELSRDVRAIADRL